MVENEKKVESKKLTNMEMYEILDKAVREGQTKDRVRETLKGYEFNENIFDTEYEKVLVDLKEEIAETKMNASSIGPGIIGGLLGAALGACLWALIVVLTEYEIGYMALGVGFLSGYGVYFLTGKKRGIILQVIAGFSSIIGLLMAKYFLVFYFIKDMVRIEMGDIEAALIKLWSPEVFSIFKEGFVELFTGYDILWLVLAILAACSIPKEIKIKK
jgi:hypothetical protein